MRLAATRLYLHHLVRGTFRPESAVVRSFGNGGAGERVAAQLRDVNVNKATRLCWLMRSQGSDKGLAWHNYTTLYRSLFAGLRLTRPRVFELGLGTNNPALASSMGARGTPGASLRGWAAFFPGAQVFGADIDRTILFEEPRIKTFYCDQLDPQAIREMWGNAALREPMQIVIEDGLHTFAANTTFLEHSIDRIAPGGYYIVEDIPSTDLAAWEERLPRYASSYGNFSFHLVQVPWYRNRTDNNLVIAARGSGA